MLSLSYDILCVCDCIITVYIILPMCIITSGRLFTMRKLQGFSLHGVCVWKWLCFLFAECELHVLWFGQDMYCYTYFLTCKLFQNTALVFTQWCARVENCTCEWDWNERPFGHKTLYIHAWNLFQCLLHCCLLPQILPPFFSFYTEWVPCILMPNMILDCHSGLFYFSLCRLQKYFTQWCFVLWIEGACLCNIYYFSVV